VRIAFIKSRAMNTSQRGDNVCAPAIAIGTDSTIANAVAITAICTVSPIPTSVCPVTEKSGGKNARGSAGRSRRNPASDPIRAARPTS
jgi:hypothetical protein